MKIFHIINLLISMKMQGYFYNRNDNEAIQTDRSEQLGTLFRNNLYQFISNETVPVIPSSLVATYPYNTEAPICTLIKTYQNTHQYKNYEEAAKQWIKDYSKALLGLVILFIQNMEFR